MKKTIKIIPLILIVFTIMLLPVSALESEKNMNIKDLQSISKQEKETLSNNINKKSYKRTENDFMLVEDITINEEDLTYDVDNAKIIYYNYEISLKELFAECKDVGSILEKFKIRYKINVYHKDLCIGYTVLRPDSEYLGIHQEISPAVYYGKKISGQERIEYIQEQRRLNDRAEEKAIIEFGLDINNIGYYIFENELYSTKTALLCENENFYILKMTEYPGMFESNDYKYTIYTVEEYIEIVEKKSEYNKEYWEKVKDDMNLWPVGGIGETAPIDSPKVIRDVLLIAGAGILAILLGIGSYAAIKTIKKK
ncbi:hypothetical protein LJB90_00350 [Eubacteriales bacterium OttesenSCG-928-G02]|nr:hypothetical protein [Eubacteriales bacterium OttesenSCG-928-G02]